MKNFLSPKLEKLIKKDNYMSEFYDIREGRFSII